MCLRRGHRLRVDRVSTIQRVEKVCSLTLREFQLNLRPLTGAPLAGHLTSAKIAIGTGNVTISYEPRSPLRLSGLLTMPVGLVTLVFDTVNDADQLVFVKRFDLAFQRGGG